MKERTLNQKIKSITAICYKRYESVFKRPMSVKQKKDLIFTLEESAVRDRLIVEYLPDGKLAYYVHFTLQFMGEFEEVFFYVKSCYCVNDPKVRAKFYKAIQKAANDLKVYEKIKRMVIEVSFEDELSKEYYSKKGFLTYIELVGNTRTGLEKLADVDLKKSPFKISKLKKEDMKKLAELDLQAHIQDKSSRMRKLFMKPNARKNMKNFYDYLLKTGNCFVIKDGKKPIGDIAFFVDKKNNFGLIACIFVANEYKNQGISKMLYKKAFMEFKKRKLVHYLGATTTTAVLATAKKIGREELKYSYIVKI